MIISPGRGYIFVHIPKTGGTSMALALEARAMKDDILIGDTPKAHRRRGRLKGVASAGRLWKHSRLADIEGLVSRDQMADLMVFTLVRNPWDRLVSYYHWLKDQSFDHPAVGLATRLTFSEFLNHPQIRASIAANPYLTYVIDSAGVPRVNHFVRLEHLRADLAPVEAHLGFRLEIGQSNRSDRPQDWRSLYSDDDAALVAKICAEDIARGGYQFHPGPNCP